MVDAYLVLESVLTQWVQRPTVVCSSGTAALHLALESFCFTPGREVIVPDFTMIACARAVTMAGLVPRFADCDARLCITAETIEPLINAKTVAIMPVHIYGRRCNMNPIVELAKAHSLCIIEDMAEVHGVMPHPETDAACWSFYRNKVIHGEEGGAVAFRNHDEAAIARELRTLGFTSRHDFYHRPRGHNYRLANCLAQLILDSFHNLNASLAARRTVEREFDRIFPPEYQMGERDSVWVYDMRIPGCTGERLYALVERLSAIGVVARCSFKPMLAQKEYADGTCRVESRRASNEVFYLAVDRGGLEGRGLASSALSLVRSI